MGIPLPKGNIKVQKKDFERELQFVAKDSIDHTPKDEKVKIFVGNSFDIIGDWRLVSIKDIDSSTWDYAFEVTLRNHKDEDVEVIVEATGFGKVLADKWYVDEFYNFLIVQPLIKLGNFFWQITDVKGVDGLANGSAKFIGFLSSKLRYAHTGLVRNYALLFVFGVIILLGFVIFK